MRYASIHVYFENILFAVYFFSCICSQTLQLDKCIFEYFGIFSKKTQKLHRKHSNLIGLLIITKSFFSSLSSVQFSEKSERIHAFILDEILDRCTQKALKSYTFVVSCRMYKYKLQNIFVENQMFPTCPATIFFPSLTFIRSV